MTTYTANWIELEGAVNVRDLGGLPTSTGQPVRPRALIRSANLQHLTRSDVALLVGELNVRRVVDLRTDLEVAAEPPGPLHAEPQVVIHHLSLYPDSDTEDRTERQQASRPTETAASASEVLLPWQRGEQAAEQPARSVDNYLRYLRRRPDSIVAALRAIAEPDGATLVHCAAGKDRTGVVIALALTVAGVDRTVIAADYAHSQSQLAAILNHLARSTIYGYEVTRPERIPPASEQHMIAVLDTIDAEFGGVDRWLASHGWTRTDDEQLLAKLVG